MLIVAEGQRTFTDDIVCWFGSCFPLETPIENQKATAWVASVSIASKELHHSHPLVTSGLTASGQLEYVAHIDSTITEGLVHEVVRKHVK